MYRALVALINMHGVVGEVTVAVSNGINASLIILCIALGVAVPNIFARRYIAKDRQRFLKEELQKRRERESSLSGKRGIIWNRKGLHPHAYGDATLFSVYPFLCWGSGRQKKGGVIV